MPHATQNLALWDIEPRDRESECYVAVRMAHWHCYYHCCPTYASMHDDWHYNNILADMPALAAAHCHSVPATGHH